MNVRLAASVLLLTGFQLPLHSQQSPDSLPHDALRVFVDCNTHCDFDYFRQEIKFVNYVRDRDVAQVQVIITGQQTGSGGTEFTFRFIGLHEFTGLDDQLRFASGASDTDDEERSGVTQTLKLGLVRYVARLPLARGLTIGYDSPESGEGQHPHDPWNYWVFELGVNGFFSGESSTRSRFLHGSVQASRVTEASKLNLGIRGNSSKNTFEIDSVTTVTGKSTSYGASALWVRSLSPHWSAGGSARANSSTNENVDFLYQAGPALEFDIFPYSESSKRQVTFLYQLSYQHADYTETTIFGKDREARVHNSLTASVDATQPWGSISASLQASAYVDDWSKNRLELFSSLDVRLFKGLSLNLFADYERVRDQLSLSAAGIDPNDILLQLKELKTSYRYDISVGLSYTFGSIFNNVVNSRFDALD